MMTRLLQTFAPTPLPVGGADIARWIGSPMGLSNTFQVAKTLELDREL